MSEIQTKARISREQWDAARYVKVDMTITGKVDGVPKSKTATARSYDEYEQLHERASEFHYTITDEQPHALSELVPGLLSAESMVAAFEKADEHYFELPSFPRFAKDLRLHAHDCVVIAAEVKSGKTSLALNMLHDLNKDHPVLYFNLENNAITLYQRLIAIHTGIELDEIAHYKSKPDIAKKVQAACAELTSGKPFIISGARELDDIEKEIRNVTTLTDETVIVCVDHGLLVGNKTGPKDFREKYSVIVDRLREFSKEEGGMNISMLLLWQLNRAGKTDSSGNSKKPTLASLKETSNIESDATKIVFLWQEVDDDGSAKVPGEKTIILAANREGPSDMEYTVSYSAKTQRYTEKAGTDGKYDLHRLDLTPGKKLSARERVMADFDECYAVAISKAKHARGPAAVPTLREVAAASGGKLKAVGTGANTIRRHVDEYGGYVIRSVGNRQSADDLLFRVNSRELSEYDEREAGIENGIAELQNASEQTERERNRAEFDAAFDAAFAKADGEVITKRDVASAYGKRDRFRAEGTGTNTIEGHVKEYGGYHFIRVSEDQKPNALDIIVRDVSDVVLIGPDSD